MGQAGECDFLIESDKSIILIEAKKTVNESQNLAMISI
jgi:Holliday junction resolvase-like predicted endonuclease